MLSDALGCIRMQFRHVRRCSEKFENLDMFEDKSENLGPLGTFFGPGGLLLLDFYGSGGLLLLLLFGARISGLSALMGPVAAAAAAAAAEPSARWRLRNNKNTIIPATNPESSSTASWLGSAQLGSARCGLA